MAQKQIPHFDDVIDMKMSEEDKLESDERRIEEEISAEFGADGESEWVVTVKMVNPTTKKQDTCFKMSPAELPGLFERLRDEFGPGEYRAYVTRNGELKRNLPYRIAKPITRSMPVAPPSQLSDLGRILERQTEMIANLARGNPASPAPVDPMAMFSAMMAALAQAKEVFAPTATQSGGLKEFIEVLTVARELTGGDGGSSNMMDVLKELVKSPIAGEIAEQFKAQREITPPIAAERPKLISSSPSEPPKVMPQLLQGLDNSMIAQIKSQVDFWVQCARRNADASLYAEVACDQFPVETLFGLVNHPGLREAAGYLNPEAIINWPWITSLIEEINHILTGDGEEAQNADEATPDPHVSGRRERAAVNPSGNSTGNAGGAHDADAHVGIDESRKKVAGHTPKSG